MGGCLLLHSPRFAHLTPSTFIADYLAVGANLVLSVVVSVVISVVVVALVAVVVSPAAGMLMLPIAPNTSRKAMISTFFLMGLLQF